MRRPRRKHSPAFKAKVALEVFSDKWRRQDEDSEQVVTEVWHGMCSSVIMLHLKDDNTPGRIARPLDSDSLSEARELFGLLQQIHPQARELDLAFVIARSFSWGLAQTEALLSFLSAIDEEGHSGDLGLLPSRCAHVLRTAEGVISTLRDQIRDCERMQSDAATTDFADTVQGWIHEKEELIGDIESSIRELEGKVTDVERKLAN